MSNKPSTLSHDNFSVGSAVDARHTGKPLDVSKANAKAIGLEGGLLKTMESGSDKKFSFFWIVQTLGWLAYIPIRIFGGITTGRTVDEYMPVAITAAIIGFLLTVGLRYVYQSIRGRPIWVIVICVSSFSALLGLGFSVIETFIWVDELYGIAVFGNAIFEAMVLFAWSSLYFGFHYYDDLLRQRQKALKATALAHQAQLTMLRYQLNPHFLFNTLNAISTLVLENDSENANKMLTKLSAFLRYTLVNKPTQKVTLDQEIYTLSLYLEIEKVRFEERLNIVYEIAEETKDALIPSLILQPHIENAIKYAIAPAENGGTIKIISRIDGKSLIMSIEDDGPGMEDTNDTISKSSSGVGIVNTRDRLEQIYGEKHAFLIQNIKPNGLRIWIKIPLERETDE